MAANANPERVRREVLCSPVRDWTHYRLAFDCGSRGCSGERTVGLRAFAAKGYGNATVANIITKLRCTTCGKPPRFVHLETGPEMASRSGWRRFPLQGVFVVEDRQ